MEEQLFSPNAAAQLFDLPLTSGGPIGFSPSIDMTSSLPHTFGDGLETPAFMLEIQRKRADTTTTLKPAFEFADDFGFEDANILDDIPQRPRAIQRLSLTSSVASSAASTASEYDYSGFESEADHSNVASPAAEDACAAPWSEASFSAFNVIQTAFDRIGFHSPTKDGTIKASTFNSAAAFSLNDFIEDQDQAAQGLALSASMDSMPACDNAGMSMMTVQMPVSPLSHSQASSEYGHEYGHAHHSRCGGSESCLGLFGGADSAHLPMSASMQPYPVNSFFGNAGPYPMVFSQSAPENACVHPHGSPCPSSPSSARSSSPFHPFGMAGAIPSVLASPPSRQIHVQHMPAQAPGLAMLPKGMSLYTHFAHLANPYAGLITKRSRGRRVPNKPEEMNNLGKSGKVYTCKVPGCGKCFKRSEHLKRHVRSIHTDDKPFLCPYPSCNKRFSRHDNLNQHARVHTSMGGADVAVEDYDASSVHSMSHLNSALSHPMVLTAAPQDGITIASGPSIQIKQE